MQMRGRGSGGQAAGAFAGILVRLWALKWENRREEALWRVRGSQCVLAFPTNDHHRASGFSASLE